MEHVDFVLWVIGWPMIPRKQEPYYSNIDLVKNIGWLTAWLGIGALLYFT